VIPVRLEQATLGKKNQWVNTQKKADDRPDRKRKGGGGGEKKGHELHVAHKHGERSMRVVWYRGTRGGEKKGKGMRVR